MNDSLTLREFCNQDIPIFKEWLYLPHISRCYHDPLDWIDEVEKRHSKFKWLHHYIAENAGNPIGFCQYYEYSNGGEKWHGNTEVNSAYSIDYLIGNTSYLGKGFGKLIIKQLIERIKILENAKRIIVQPESENKQSCNTLLSCGFHFDKQNEIFLIDL